MNRLPPLPVTKIPEISNIRAFGGIKNVYKSKDRKYVVKFNCWVNERDVYRKAKSWLMVPTRFFNNGETQVQLSLSTDSKRVKRALNRHIVSPIKARIRELQDESINPKFFLNTSVVTFLPRFSDLLLDYSSSLKHYLKRRHFSYKLISSLRSNPPNEYVAELVRLGTTYHVVDIHDGNWGVDTTTNRLFLLDFESCTLTP